MQKRDFIITAVSSSPLFVLVNFQTFVFLKQHNETALNHAIGVLVANLALIGWMAVIEYLYAAFSRWRGNLPKNEEWVIYTLLRDLDFYIDDGDEHKTNTCCRRIIHLWNNNFGFSQKIVSKISYKLARAITVEVEAEEVSEGVKSSDRWRKRLNARIAELEGKQPS